MSDREVLPFNWIVLGFVGLGLYLLFVYWAVGTVYQDHGLVAAVLSALLISIPMKKIIAPRIISVLKSKKI